MTVPEEPRNVLEVRSLTKLFSRPRMSLFRPPETVTAVHRVSFSLPRGSVVGLVGETGSGKTTLGRLVMRLIEPTSGSILFNGTDLAKIRGKELRNLRKHFQMVFQDPYSSLNPRMTVRETVEEPFLVHGVDPHPKTRKKALEELMVRVGLDPGDLDRFPREFSGGGRQRVGIARAIALNPDFLVADEPISSLDVSIQAQIVNLFARLNQKDGMTMLFISHDLSVVSYLSDFVLILYRGMKVESGSTQAVFQNPRHPYTRLLIASVPGWNDGITGTRGSVKVLAPASDNGPSPPLCPFSHRCPDRMDICLSEPPPVWLESPLSDRSPEGKPSWPREVACHLTFPEMDTLTGAENGSPKGPFA
jgi:oligopeptide/dipeptide ABC transporter ATP-binding protein